MLATDFQEIVENAAGFCGLDRENLDAGEFADFRGFAGNRLRYAWGFRDWDELVRTQQRWFRAEYNAVTAYAAPTATTAVEVFDPATQLYYQSLRSTTGNAPSVAGVENSAYWAECADEYSGEDWADATAYIVGDQVISPINYRVYQCHTAHTSSVSFDATKFGILTPFDRYVAYEQTGKDAIGDVLRVTEKNPKTHANTRDIDKFTSENGVQITEDVVFIWLQFRMRCPQLKGAAYDATLIYTATTSQIYYQTSTTRGNFYNCVTTTSAGDSPASAAAKWAIVEIPRCLQGWIENGLAADWLADESPNKAGKHEAMADGLLAAEALRHDEQSSTRLEVATR